MSVAGGVWSGAMVLVWGMVLPSCGRTNTCKNITFPQLLLRAVINKGTSEINVDKSTTYVNGMGYANLSLVSTDKNGTYSLPLIYEVVLEFERNQWW